MKRFPSTTVLTFLMVLSMGAMSQHRAADSISVGRSRKVPAVQMGTASYYHDKFEGRKTASGTIFTQKGMTAASNRFPLNCWVRVTNLSNHRSVLVKITDRMHPQNKRLIDLTRTAARKLAYIEKGLTRVKVEYLGRRKPVGDK